MNSDDRLGARRDLPFDILWVDRPALRVDIGEDQFDSGHAEGNGGGREGVTGQDQFIAGFEAAKDRGETQRIGGVIHGEGMIRADVCLEVCFELAHVIALSLHFGIAHHIDDGFDLRFGVSAHTGWEVHAITSD